MKLQLLNRRFPFYKSLFSINSFIESPRLYCTNSVDSYCSNDSVQDSSGEEEKKKKETLYSRISPLGNPRINVTPVLDKWTVEGRKVRFAELLRIVHDLRKRSRFSHALQVLEWTKRQDTFTVSSTEHALLIDLIGRVHGYLSAETYFNSLSEQDKTNKTYGALLHCYVRQRQIDKSLSHLRNMKEKGLITSAVQYNDIMSLYTNLGQHEKVPDVLAQMKESGVSPNSLSYRICINSYGQRSNIEGMEKILDEMENHSCLAMDWNTYAVAANFYMKAGLNDKASYFLERAEEGLDKKDTTGYNHLISLHANMKNKGKVFRLWDLEKSNCRKLVNRDFINMLKCLVKLGELEAAAEVLKDWESSGNCYDFQVPKIVIDGYTRKELFEKAEAMLEDFKEKGKATAPDSWSKVAEGFLEKRGEMEKAVECMKIAFSLNGDSKGWKPNSSVVKRIIEEFAGKEESKEAMRAFVGSLRTFVTDNNRTDSVHQTVDDAR